MTQPNPPLGPESVPEIFGAQMTITAEAEVIPGPASEPGTDDTDNEEPR